MGGPTGIFVSSWLLFLVGLSLALVGLAIEIKARHVWARIVEGFLSCLGRFCS